MEISDVAVFVKVVQAGSFTKAAAQLGAPKSTVSAKVASLERRLGVTLLQRTTRVIRVTNEGEVLFRVCAQALADITAAESVVASQKETPHGHLVVTLPVDTGRFIGNFLKPFLRKYPQLKVDLLLTNRYVDLIAEGVDVAIRAGVLKDTTLMARRLGMSHRVLFAAPSYLRHAAPLNHPHDLRAHECLRFVTRQTGPWILSAHGRTVRVKVDGRITADDLTSTKELALAGHGIALLPPVITHDDVAHKRLVPLLPDWRTPAVPVSIVYPAQKFQHPKVRVFVEEAAAAMKAAYDL